MFDVVEHRILASLGRVVLASVLAIVLLAALIAPNFGPSGWTCYLNANESAAMATLKNIHACQTQFRDAAAIDRDGDGQGEFGWFRELAGAPLRDRIGPAATPFLSTAFRQLTDGRVARSGYLFQLWLPGWPSGWVGEGHGGDIDQAAAESQFRCAAWPATEDSGKRAFFVDAAGDVFGCRNDDWHYCGTERPVPAEAAIAPAAEANPELTVQPMAPTAWYVVQ